MCLAICALFFYTYFFMFFFNAWIWFSHVFTRIIYYFTYLLVRKLFYCKRLFEGLKGKILFFVIPLLFSLDTAMSLTAVKYIFNLNTFLNFNERDLNFKTNIKHYYDKLPSFVTSYKCTCVVTFLNVTKNLVLNSCLYAF